MMNELQKAINSLHQHNIYHNDLTPRNMIQGLDGNLYIIDFGRATDTIPKQNAFAQKTTIANDKRKQKSYNSIPVEGDYRALRYIDQYGSDSLL